MKLPNGEQAIVDDRKLLDYVLSPVHPYGRTHAFLFERLLGITQANAEILRSSLLTAAAGAEALDKGDAGYGTKYEIQFSLDGPRKRFNIMSVWIVPLNDATQIPRLVTAYVL